MRAQALAEASAAINQQNLAAQMQLSARMSNGMAVPQVLPGSLPGSLPGVLPSAPLPGALPGVAATVVPGLLPGVAPTVVPGLLPVPGGAVPPGVASAAANPLIAAQVIAYAASAQPIGPTAMASPDAASMR